MYGRIQIITRVHSLDGIYDAIFRGNSCANWIYRFVDILFGTMVLIVVFLYIPCFDHILFIICFQQFKVMQFLRIAEYCAEVCVRNREKEGIRVEKFIKIIYFFTKINGLNDGLNNVCLIIRAF